MRNTMNTKTMNDCYLVMKWDYKYDKESTWFDEDSGEEQYQLREGASYTLPHIREKSLEICSVTTEGDDIKVKLTVDYESYTVCSGEEPVVGYAHYDYSVAGDSVSQTLCMKFTIQ